MGEIRDAFREDSRDFKFSKRTSKDKALRWFTRGCKSRDPEVGRLRDLLEIKILENCKGSSRLDDLHNEIEHLKELLNIIHGQLPEGLSHLKKAIEEVRS